MTDIGDNADDHSQDLLPCIIGNGLTERVLARPECPGHRFVDHHYGLTQCATPLRKPSPYSQWTPHRLKISIAHNANIGLWMVTLRIDLPFYGYGPPAVVA